MSTTFADHLRALPDDGAGRAAAAAPRPRRAGARRPVRAGRPGAVPGVGGAGTGRAGPVHPGGARRAAADPGPRTGCTSVDAVLALTASDRSGVEPAQVRAAAVDRLRTLALVYGPDTALQVVGGVDEVCSPYPAGLGRPAAELDAAGGRLVRGPGPAAADPAVRPAAGPGGAGPAGRGTAGRHGHRRRRREPDNPVALAGRPRAAGGQAGPSGDAGYETVELPREIGMLLRRDTGPLGAAAPAAAAAARRAARPDGGRPGRGRPGDGGGPAGRGAAGGAGRRAGAGAALRRAGRAGPAPAGQAAGLDEPTAALLLEVAYAAGLLGDAGRRRPADDASSCPPRGYDTWRVAPTGAALGAAGPGLAGDDPGAGGWSGSATTGTG